MFVVCLGLLDVEDLTAVARPDEKSVMTYISEFFHRFASQDIKEQAARRVQRFLNFALDMEKQVNHLFFASACESERCSFFVCLVSHFFFPRCFCCLQQKEYESRAGSLIEWARTTANAMTEGKFGDTVEFANQLYGEFRSFLVSEKPTKAAEKLDVEVCVQFDYKSNSRCPWTCTHRYSCQDP